MKFGIDPSDIALEAGEGIELVRDIFPSRELASRTGGEPFDIITSVAMFYDLEDPVQFTRGIKQLLAKTGLWVFEMSYMPMMLRMNSYDTICHEHLEYYSLAVIENVLKRAEMKIVDVSLNGINGGSIRCFATHADNYAFRREAYAQNLRTLRQEEFDMELDTDKPYRNFQDHIKRPSRGTHRTSQKAEKGGKEDPRVRRVNEGKHHPPVVRDRQEDYRCGRRQEPGQIRGHDTRYRYSHHKRGGVAEAETRLLSLSSPGTSVKNSSRGKKRQ